MFIIAHRDILDHVEEHDCLAVKSAATQQVLRNWKSLSCWPQDIIQSLMVRLNVPSKNLVNSIGHTALTDNVTGPFDGPFIIEAQVNPVSF